MDFASSGYARDFFQGQVPQIIRSLKSIADSQQKLVELQMKQNSSVDKPVDNPTLPAEVIAEGTIYVCYEENSTALYADAGNINHTSLTKKYNSVIISRNMMVYVYVEVIVLRKRQGLFFYTYTKQALDIV